MVNVTKKHNPRKRSRRISEPEHLILPHYTTDPPNPQDGEVWFDLTNDKIRYRKEGTTLQTAALT